MPRLRHRSPEPGRDRLPQRRRRVLARPAVQGHERRERRGGVGEQRTATPRPQHRRRLEQRRERDGPVAVERLLDTAHHRLARPVLQARRMRLRRPVRCPPRHPPRRERGERPQLRRGDVAGLGQRPVHRGSVALQPVVTPARRRAPGPPPRRERRWSAPAPRRRGGSRTARHRRARSCVPGPRRGRRRRRRPRSRRRTAAPRGPGPGRPARARPGCAARRAVAWWTLTPAVRPTMSSTGSPRSSSARSTFPRTAAPRSGAVVASTASRTAGTTDPSGRHEPADPHVLEGLHDLGGAAPEHRGHRAGIGRRAQAHGQHDVPQQRELGLPDAREPTHRVPRREHARALPRVRPDAVRTVQHRVDEAQHATGARRERVDRGRRPGPVPAGAARAPPPDRGRGGRGRPSCPSSPISSRSSPRPRSTGHGRNATVTWAPGRCAASTIRRTASSPSTCTSSTISGAPSPPRA